MTATGRDRKAPGSSSARRHLLGKVSLSGRYAQMSLTAGIARLRWAGSPALPGSRRVGLTASFGRFSVAWLRSAHDSGAGATEGTVEAQPTRRREAEHGDRDRRKRERQRHRPLFRGPRLGSAGGADPRLSPQRALVGAARTRAAGGGVPRDQLRPTRVRPVEPADRRLRLRHLRCRPQRPAGASRPSGHRAGRVLDGDRRGHPLPRALRLGPGAQGRTAGRDPAVPAADRRQPRGRPR